MASFSLLLLLRPNDEPYLSSGVMVDHHKNTRAVNERENIWRSEPALRFLLITAEIIKINAWTRLSRLLLTEVL